MYKVCLVDVKRREVEENQNQEDNQEDQEENLIDFLGYLIEDQEGDQEDLEKFQEKFIHL